MPAEWRRAWAVAGKDLLTERRAKAAFNAMAFFAGLVLLTFGVALGPDAPAGDAGRGTLLQELAPGLLWVTILFAGVLAVDRSFQVELERGGMEGLRLYPGDRKAVYLGKLIANVSVMLLMEVLVLPFAGVLYSLDLWTRLPGLAVVAALATLGFAAMGTFYAALTANLRARQVLLPLLMFPVLIPVILAAVKATGLVLHGDPMDELASWVKLLGAADVLFLTVCTLAFEYVIEE
ncbi:MAG TPA: heme exporter protein CcmB [Gemmatimonadales bacterium]|nr:heme exporter protein CcmB [Gemmatimonadales bacterium]